MKDENILVWYKGCSLVLNWCCSHSLWWDILFQFLTSGFFKKKKANLKKSLCSDRLSRLWSCAQKMPRPPSPSACVSEDRAGCAPGWWRAVQYAPSRVGMVPREYFLKHVSLSVIFGWFPALMPGSWQQPVHAGFEVGTIMPVLLLATVIHDLLLFGNSLQLLITIDLVLHE